MVAQPGHGKHHKPDTFVVSRRLHICRLLAWAAGPSGPGHDLVRAARASAEGWAALCAHPAAAQHVLGVLVAAAQAAGLPRYQTPAAGASFLTFLFVLMAAA